MKLYLIGIVTGAIAGWFILAGQIQTGICSVTPDNVTCHFHAGKQQGDGK